MRTHAAIDDLVIPRRLRVQVEIDTALVNSIKAHGVLHPLLVYAAGDGRYTLIDGERRLAHARAAGLRSVPVTEVPEKDALERLMIEREANRHREGWNALENARYYARLRDEHDWTQTQIAASEGCSQGRISQHFRLLDMTSEAQDAVVAGLLDFTGARLVSRLNNEPALQRRLVAHIAAKAARDKPLTSRGIRTWIERERASDEELDARRVREAVTAVEALASRPTPLPSIPPRPVADVEFTGALESGADPLAAMLLREMRETLDALARLDSSLLEDPELDELWDDVEERWKKVERCAS